MILKEPKLVPVRYGGDVGVASAYAYAEFDGGCSHFVDDEGQWMLINSGHPSYHLFPEAVGMLKLLPNSPKECPQPKTTQQAQQAMQELIALLREKEAELNGRKVFGWDAPKPAKATVGE